MCAPTLGRNHTDATSVDEPLCRPECWSPTSTHIQVSSWVQWLQELINLEMSSEINDIVYTFKGHGRSKLDFFLCLIGKYNFFFNQPKLAPKPWHCIPFTSQLQIKWFWIIFAKCIHNHPFLCAVQQVGKRYTVSLGKTWRSWSVTQFHSKIP